jgi:hypothetical protein
MLHFPCCLYTGCESKRLLTLPCPEIAHKRWCILDSERRGMRHPRRPWTVLVIVFNLWRTDLTGVWRGAHLRRRCVKEGFL